jgi:hypothetical protein
MSHHVPGDRRGFHVAKHQLVHDPGGWEENVMSWGTALSRQVNVPRFSALMLMIVCTLSMPALAVDSGEITHSFRAEGYEILERNGIQEIRMSGSEYTTINSPGDPALPELILECEVPSSSAWST